jgi:protein-S-isoprenylcysteine O-methyltransferase Ste14
LAVEVVMTFVVMGAIGFAIIHFCDIVALRNVPWAKPLIWLAGSGLVVYATVAISLSETKLALPDWLVIIGWPLLITSLYLLIYSLFINLPFRKTYLATGVGDRLVTSGLYTLVRHPWLHSFSLLMISLLLISQSNLLLVAIPLWIVLNILLVIIQDRFFFSRMFPGYRDYRRQTPMLIPNRKSINLFLSQFTKTANRQSKI